MHIEYLEGLLLASLTVTYGGQTKQIDRMAIDTGTAHTIIASDAVGDIGIFLQTGDHINRSYGIGGADYAFEKTVDSLEFGGFLMRRKPLDLGHIDWDINGLIGLDILLPGRFVIDLDAREIYQNGMESE